MKRALVSIGVFAMTLFIAWAHGLDIERGIWQGFSLLSATVLAGYVYFIPVWGDDK